MSAVRSELEEIYRHRVLDHSRNPHNFRQLADANAQAIGHNPLCGDKLTVYAQLNDQRIDDIAFEGTGCAICVASASMMTDVLHGCTLDEANSRIAQARQIFSGKAISDPDDLRELEALAGVSKYPSRIKCAALAWSTAEAAFGSNEKLVTTED